MLGQLGYGYAYRIFDAQYFGVAQRRRRVFVVGCAGDWRAAAAVLFERHSLSGHPAPRRSAPKNIAGAITSGAFAGGADGRPEGAAGNHFIPVTGTLSARTKGGGGLGTDFECSGGLAPVPHAEISPALKARDHKGPSSDGDGNGAILIPMAYGTPGNWISRKPENGGNAVEPMLDLAPCQTKTDVHAVCAPTLTSNGDSHSGFRDEQGLITNGQMRVRRLTPTECERLQGFPDSYTSIPVKKVRPNRLQSPRADKSYREINGEVWQLASDGPRYNALGNSWAVPCARWIGERIEMVDKIAADA
jgi:DNA (cytosine-5)-methyltransferase 1